MKSAPVSPMKMVALPLGPVRIEVVAKKAQGGAQQRRRHAGHQELPVGDGQEKEEGGGHGGDAGGEAIHVVQEVHGVGDAHHPEHGDGDVQLRLVQELHLHARPDQDGRAQEFGDELGQWTQALAAAVIPEADRGHQRTAGQDGRGLAQIARRVIAARRAAPPGRRREYTATPPSRGIGEAWILRAPGMSTTPRRMATRRAMGVPAWKRQGHEEDDDVTSHVQVKKHQDALVRRRSVADRALPAGSEGPGVPASGVGWPAARRLRRAGPAVCSCCCNCVSRSWSA